MHPDVHYIRQDTPCGGIKIEQIRELQQQIYYTPQLGKHRLIVMESADKMNLSSANALLKILEEPPEHTLFILIAEQMSSLPVTLISRCQKYIFPTRESSGVSGPLEEFIQGQSYPGGSSRAELLKQVPAMMAGLCDFIEGKCSPCLLATQWSSYAFDDVLWLLYLMTAQAIYDQLMGPERRLSDNVTWKSFSQLVDTVHLFHQLDEISAAIRKISHNVNINQTLVVENLLLGYLGIGPEGLFDRTKNDH
jgi:DNA polymerase-3 subunit delta'